MNSTPITRFGRDTINKTPIIAMEHPRYTDIFDGADFNERRGCAGAGGSGGLNAFDPNSLITERELQAGLTYSNSFRYFGNQSEYLQICSGTHSIDAILRYNGRILKA